MPASVFVTVSLTANKKSISIAVDQEPVDLGLLGDVDDVTWELVDSSGWKFTPPGIDIKGHGNIFHDNGVSGGGKKHGWTRKIRNHQTYKYAINVTDGTMVLTWDPKVVNN